jgi:hypothetical protein
VIRGAPHEDGELAYRIGYWVVNRAGKWQWGQYSLISPAVDLDVLLEKARRDGTLLPESGVVGQAGPVKP